MKNVKYCRSSLLVLVSLLILVELNRRQIDVTVLQKPGAIRISLNCSHL